MYVQTSISVFCLKIEFVLYIFNLNLKLTLQSLVLLSESDQDPNLSSGL